MKKVWIFGFACCLALFMSSAARAQSSFVFSFDGPDSFAGSADAVVSGDYTVNLTHMGDPPSAQGWSYGVEVEGGVPTAFTDEGTTAAENYDTPFKNNAIIDPAANDGKQGFVSAIVLSLSGSGAVLPDNATSSLMVLSVDFTIPAGGGAGALRVVSGLTGTGQPVDVVVTVEGGSGDFTTEDKDVALNEEVTCCGAEFTVGFSGERLMNTTPGEGLIDDTETCNAAGSMDASGPTTVYANVASNSANGVQGWSVSIEVDGDVGITDVTRQGTSAGDAPDGRWDSGFDNTSLANPDASDGRRGAVSAIVLCLTGCGATLDPMGTESILQLSVDQVDPAAEAASGNIFFASGLVGSGQPVDNVLTVEGGSGTVCNWDTARLTVNIAPPVGSNVLPGDANNDAKVDIGDPIYTLNALFREGPDLPCALAADSNGDRVVDSADAIYTINYQFVSGPAPADGTECVTIEADAAGELTCEDSACDA